MAAQGAFGTDVYERSILRPKHRAYYCSSRPVIKIGPKGALGSHEIRAIHSAPSLGQSILGQCPLFGQVQHVAYSFFIASFAETIWPQTLTYSLAILGRTVRWYTCTTIVALENQTYFLILSLPQDKTEKAKEEKIWAFLEQLDYSRAVYLLLFERLLLLFTD